MEDSSRPVRSDDQLALDLGRPTGGLWTVAISGPLLHLIPSCSAAATSPPPTAQMPAPTLRFRRFTSRRETQRGNRSTDGATQRRSGHTLTRCPAGTMPPRFSPGPAAVLHRAATRLSLDHDETTDKGYTNQRRVLERRAASITELFAEPPASCAASDPTEADDARRRFAAHDTGGYGRFVPHARMISWRLTSGDLLVAYGRWRSAGRCFI